MISCPPQKLYKSVDWSTWKAVDDDDDEDEEEEDE